MGSHSAGDRGASPPPPPEATPRDTTSDDPPTRFQTYDYPMPEPQEFRTANPYRVQAPAAPAVPVKRKGEIGNRLTIGAITLAGGLLAGFIVGINQPAPPSDAATFTVTPTVTETVTKSPKASPSPSPKPVSPGFDDGTYVVGEDIKAGRYTTAEDAGEGCYWEISKSGTNGGSIVENEFSAGGKQVVTLAVGQDFHVEDCGKWVRK